MGIKRRCCLHAAGEDPHSGIVASITNGNPCLVTCVDDERLEFQVSSLADAIEWGGVGQWCAMQPATAAAAA